MADLYRKSSLDKLSNPEQLDRMIKISSPLSWLALVAVFLVIAATLIWSIVGTLPTIETVNGIIVDSQSVNAVYAPAAGTLESYTKQAGDTVTKGEQIATILLPDNTQKAVLAPCNGTVSMQSVEEGGSVFAGSEVAKLTPSDIGAQVVLCFVPLSSAQKFEAGMEVLVYPTSIDSQKYGHMVAEIVTVDDFATNIESMVYVLGSGNNILDQFTQNGPIVTVVCQIKTDATTKSGFAWSSDNAKDLTVSNDMMVSAKIVVEESRPISKLFGKFKDSSEG